MMLACAALVPLAGTVFFADDTLKDTLSLRDSLIERFQVEQASASARALRSSYVAPGGRQLPVPDHLLDNCSKIYLDMGLNNGEKFFVLYEPDVGYRQRQQPFSATFGHTYANRQDVCAMGFEPNGNLTWKLQRVRRRFERRGHRVYIFNAAIAPDSGSRRLYSDSDSQHRVLGTWGKTLVKYDERMAGRSSESVQAVSLAWLLHTVLLPKPGAARPRVLAKMDVEGAEYELISFNWPLICQTIDLLVVERHDRFFQEGWRRRVGSKRTHESEIGARRIHHLDRALDRMRNQMRNTKGCRTHVQLENPREANPNWVANLTGPNPKANRTYRDSWLFR